MPGAKRCASAQLIRRYRAFAIKVISATWKSVALAAIKVKAAYSPAEALFNRLAKKPCSGVRPAYRAAMPREKETAK